MQNRLIELQIFNYLTQLELHRRDAGDTVLTLLQIPLNGRFLLAGLLASSLKAQLKLCNS